MGHLCTWCYPAGTGEFDSRLLSGASRPSTLTGTWERKSMVKVAMPSGSGSGILAILNVGGGRRLSVTHVINYFLTISSVSAS